MPRMTFDPSMTQSEAVIFFRFHVKMLISLYEVCPEDLDKRLEKDPVDSMVNAEIAAFVRALDKAYAAEDDLTDGEDA